jgi:hypothetical protein
VEEEPVGCAKPTGAVIGEDSKPEEQPGNNGNEGGRTMVMARVGGRAPDFQAPAYYRGKFVNIKLSDYLGKWVLICFYPGDYTFV